MSAITNKDREIIRGLAKGYLEVCERPSPSMVTHGYDHENCRNIVRKGLEDSRDCNIEFMLKEMLTVQNDPYRLADFAEMAVEEAERIE